MGRKKKDSSTSVEEKPVSRKELIREYLWEIIQAHQPLLERKFTLDLIMDPNGTRGLLRDAMRTDEEDLKSEDKKTVFEILQDLKGEGALVHVSRDYWARLK